MQEKDRRAPRPERIRAALTALWVAAALGMIFPTPANCTEAPNFPPFKYDILNADTGDLIGHGHYDFDQTAGGLVLRGENRYLNGEFDAEEDRLTEAGGEHLLPKLVRFRHDFYGADGALAVAARLDAETGLGVCGRAADGKMDLKSEQFKFPDDTYAGASVLLPIQEFVGQGNRGGSLKLHVFNCVPGPKLVAVAVSKEPKQFWARYPGSLEKVDIKPDFGFWTIVVLPFIPKLAAWFDPSAGALLVGARLQRYYKGIGIILVRARGVSEKSPSVMGAPPP